MHKEHTAEWFFGSLRYIQALVCRIEIVYAIFIGLGVIIEMPVSWTGILFVLAVYISLNLFVVWNGKGPNLTELFTNLTLCGILTFLGANYSAILYHLLLIRTTLRSDRERAGRIVVLISMVFLASSIFRTESINSRYALNVMFNFLGLGILAFATMYVRGLVVKQVTTDVRVKELIKQNDYNHHMAITDRMTGLYNYRGYLEKIESIGQCVLLLIDIDYFKKLNDTYGHLYGDKVLATLGQIIKVGLRKEDLAFRYGGEEFVIALPQTSLQVAYKVAERLRERVAEYPFRCDQDCVPITISIGMAFKHQDDDTKRVFEQADSALYQAKRLGRNNVQLCEDLGAVQGSRG